MPVTKITVLISGSGTNLQALIDACSTPSLPNTQIIRVISNRKDAYGLQRAEKAKIPILYHNLISYKKRYPDTTSNSEKSIEGVPSAPTFAEARSVYDKDLAELVLKDEPDLVFNGAHAIERAWKAFQEKQITKTGIMVHYVISEVDMGEPILTRDIEMREGEGLEELEQRIHQNEWEIIVQGTKMAIEKLKGAPGMQ
ncbi:Bifunctional purine biosynthetic protein ADE5,7 [Taxawa tesnikishii (nom. ined.)]|nr:Bifunctional purine biosynthetic protein ADE5,7 [Dothideales sp. JES 119]